MPAIPIFDIVENTERFKWAVAIMNIEPHHQVLEIGCGVGLAVEEIAPLLQKGAITAIDRSVSMIEKAKKRNRRFNHVTFLTNDLLHLPAGTHSYDIIFLFNINFFWTKQSITKEMAIIRTYLSKKGKLYILYGPMFGGGFEKMNLPVRQNLAAENFNVLEVLHHKNLRCCCFVAVPCPAK